MASQNLHKRTFASQDQAAFAALSGDYNPLHMDPLLARRLIYGAPVVHGIHCLLWALDCWIGQESGLVQFTSLDTEFPKPLRVGEEAELTIISVSPGFVKLEATSSGSTVLKAECRWSQASEPLTECDRDLIAKREPKVLQAEDLKNRKGVLELAFHRETGLRMFPHLGRQLPPSQIAVLLGTTRLVGMECPGLHSVFYSLTLNVDATSLKDELEFEVTNFHRRFQMLLMNVTGAGLSGEIKAFLRPAPQQQISYVKAKEIAGAHEFAGQRALIVGGSRGLGEVAAKLLAAGGADVKITYHQGHDEAGRIVDEIKSEGGTAASFRVDVLSPITAGDLEVLRGWSPDSLYYFATPFIFAGSKGGFSDKLFAKFCGYYVTGFVNVLNAFGGVKLQKIFHPSSIAVEELPPDMVEYTAAKTAAETLCLALEKNEGIPIYKPRLPRLNTDQTVSLMPAGNKEPVPVLLEHLRVFRDMPRVTSHT